MDTRHPSERVDDIVGLLPCLKEKFIVDLTNSIDVTRDHIRVQREKTGLFARLYDGFTGRSAHRQAEINASFADGTEGALKWLVELTDSLTTSDLALTRVSKRVNEIREDIVRLAEYSAATHKRLEKLSEHLTLRCDDLASEIARVDFEQRANRQLEQVFNKWRAGRYASFSAAGRLYAVLEELRWGDFGAYCREHTGQLRQDFIDDLVNRAIRQLVEDLKLTSYHRPEVRIWLSPPTHPLPVSHALEALAYLGDWATRDNHPFVYTTTQAPEELPLGMPRLSAPERMTKALVAEVLEEEPR